MKRLIAIYFALLFMNNIVIIAQENTHTFTYKVGEYELILLSEGQAQGNSGILIGATPEMLRKTMPDGGFPNAINAFLVRIPDKNILIDTGVGRNLLTNLQSFGLSPEDIHTIVITHMHGDHTGGLIKDGENVFKNAKILLGETEHNYWTSREEMNKLPENRRGGFVSAQNILKAYAGNIDLIKLEKLTPKESDGIFFIEAYGHTPGHMACLIKSGKEQILIWADVTHAMAIQMPYPQISVTYDVNPVQAAETRKEILEYVTKNNIPVAGMHIPYPGIGEVKASDKGGYVFVGAQ